MPKSNIKTIRFHRKNTINKILYDKSLLYNRNLKRYSIFNQRIRDSYKNRLWRNVGLKGLGVDLLGVEDVAVHKLFAPDEI